ncbi:hypothetical protein ACTOVL_06125 [Arcanobacterium canis]
MMKFLPIPQSWEAPISQWETRLKAFGKSPETLRTRRVIIRMFAREIGCAPQDVTEETIMTWAGSKDWEPETRHSKITTLRQFFKWYSHFHAHTRVSLLHA